MGVVEVNNWPGSVPAFGGGVAPSTQQSARGTVPSYGGFDYLGDDHPDVAPPDERWCTATKADGLPCHARRAKDTEWCIWHLRSMKAETFLDEAIAEIDSGVHAPEHP